MNTALPTRQSARASALASCLLLASLALAPAQIIVDTLGGGLVTPSGSHPGFLDGNTLNQAQFNNPLGMVADPTGRFLYVADRDNGAVRKLDLTDKTTTTVITNLPSPVAVLLDRSGNLCVLTRTEGLIRRYDTNNIRIADVNAAGMPFTLPNAMALDSSTNFYVVEAGGALLRINPMGGIPVLISPAGTFTTPWGVAITESGSIAVSDTGAHAIRVVNPADGTVALLAGLPGTAAFADGVAGTARFNTPYNLVKAPNGLLVVADRLNHSLRAVQTNGYTTTLYGLDPAAWEDCASCSPPVYLGWSDGTVVGNARNGSLLNPAAHDPLGVALVGAGSKLYVSEAFYHIIREASGLSPLLGPVDGGSSTNSTNAVVFVPAPTVTPNSGYFPMGVTLTVNSTEPDVFYTTDGTEPTTNGSRVIISSNIGSIRWTDATRTLASLRLKAFNGTNASTTVSGQGVTASTIGVPSGLATNMVAFPGSKVFIPVVLNLVSNTSVGSFFFTAEFTGGTVPVLATDLDVEAVPTNGYARYVGIAANLSDLPTAPVNTPGIRIFAPEGAVTSPVSGSAVLAILTFTVPLGALEGDVYSVTITNQSAALPGGATISLASGASASVRIAAIAPLAVTATATNNSFLVGDTAPSGWFGSGEFGDGNITIADVNNVFLAVAGVRVPPQDSDARSALDASPSDLDGVNPAWGGDGDLLVDDFLVILARSQRDDLKNYRRLRAAGGARYSIGPITLTGAPDAPAPVITHQPGNLWVRHAQLRAGRIGNVSPGAIVKVPISLNLVSGKYISDALFRAVVTPDNGGAPISDNVSFDLAPGIPGVNTAWSGNVFGGTLYPNEIVCTWMGMTTPWQGSNLLGWLSFRVPANAPAGQSYTVRFPASSGTYSSAGTMQNAAFESLPGSVVVSAPVSTVLDNISDQWRTTFFGNVNSPLSAANEDADGDGASNLQEYLAGTHPMDRNSRFSVLGARGGGALSIKWVSVPYKTYIIESAASPAGPWATEGFLPGTGEYADYVPAVTNSSRFYRVRLSP
jgi:sugar lactone lactonase YvrE